MGSLYLKLFHGRGLPNEQLNDWGSDGPVFGPLSFVHTTYASLIHLGEPDHPFDSLGDLQVIEGLVYYDGVYYGDWSVFGEDQLDEHLRGLIQPYDEGKAGW
jgi:hypothetical protein